MPIVIDYHVCVVMHLVIKYLCTYMYTCMYYVCNAVQNGILMF